MMNTQQTQLKRLSGFSTIIGSITFFCVVAVLGFIQPGYDHLRDTISLLVLGQWGWIQVVNFIQLAVTVFLFGLGLGWSLHNRMPNRTSAIFTFFALVLMVSALFPTHPVVSTSFTELLSAQSPAEHTHELLVLVMVVIAPLFLFPLFVDIKKNQRWRSLASYGGAVFVFNCCVGWLWLYLVQYEWFDDWKGFLQKVLIVNILAWMMVMGRKMTVRMGEN